MTPGFLGERSHPLNVVDYGNVAINENHIFKCLKLRKSVVVTVLFSFFFGLLMLKTSFKCAKLHDTVVLQ